MSEYIITMSAKEAERVPVMEDLIGGRIKQKDVPKILGVTTRQIRRILKKYKKHGADGLTHKSRGRTGN